ncbi:MAG: hypothetical protein HDS16_03650 [Bacteroides sp.]|nr:hypothetical protein [Bacteroides sp.]
MCTRRCRDVACHVWVDIGKCRDLARHVWLRMAQYYAHYLEQNSDMARHVPTFADGIIHLF